jgi:hypothetical protein
MTPTGNTTADMIFTGLMLVLHLAALVGLGFMLGRLRCRYAVDEALAAVKESAETHKRMGSLIEQLRNDLDKARSTNVKGQGVVVRVIGEEMPEECRESPSKWATWMNSQSRTMNLAGELAQTRIDRNYWRDRAMALMEVEDAAYDYRSGIIQREEDEREWCAAGKTVSAAELAERAARLDKAMEGRSL